MATKPATAASISAFGEMTRFAELRQRIRKTLDYVLSVPEKDFANADQQKVAPAWLGATGAHRP